MPPLRPLLDRFTRDPWISSVPVDDSSVGAIVPRQVQIGFAGSGPLSERRLVPLTPAAHELLYGTHRDGARQALRGVLEQAQQMGTTNLRGISLATDDAGFATNLLVSNIEAGLVPNSIATRNRQQLEQDFTQLGAATKVAKAQNTGWMDLGTRASTQLLQVIKGGPTADRDASTEAALTVSHELEHSATPPNPKTIGARHVWLEEGIAETLAWWPGRARGMMSSLGAPLRKDIADPDPYTVPADSVASREYRDRHRAVLTLLDIAGIQQFDEAGTPSSAHAAQARQLLQGQSIERVPRSLARAIAQRHGLSHTDEVALRDLILDVAGKPEAAASLRDTIQGTPAMASSH